MGLLWTSPWFWAVALVKATMVLVGVELALLAWRRATPGLRHLLVSLALVGFVLMPLLSVVLPSWTISVPQGFVERWASEGAFLTSLPTEGSSSALETPWAEKRLAESEAAYPRHEASGAHGATWSWTHGALALWAAGVLLLLGRLGVGVVRTLRVVGRASEALPGPALDELDAARRDLRLTVRPRVLYSGEVRIPMAWGLLRPAIVLPPSARTWSAERLRMVFLHELAHLKRWDQATLLVCRFVTAIYWFHPLVWVASRQERKESEQACDSLVLKSGARPSEYAMHLLDIARGAAGRMPLQSVALAMAQPSGLESRVRHILAPQPRALSGQATLGLLLGLGLAIGFGAGLVVEADGPGLHGSWFERGMDLHRSGRWEEAVEAFGRAESEGGKTSVAIYNQACGLALMGRSDEALRALERSLQAGLDDPDLLSSDPDLTSLRGLRRFEAMVERARSRRLEGKSAQEAFARLKSRGGTAKEWHLLGTKLLAMGELEPAGAALRRAVESKPSYADAHYNLACVHARSGNLGAAVEAVESAIESGYGDATHMASDPDLSALHGTDSFERLVERCRLLELESKGKDWSRVRDGAEQVLARSPRSGRAWFNLGYATHYLGDHLEAAEAFSRAAELGYKTSVSAYNVGCAYAQGGEPERAIDWLERSAAEGFEVKSRVMDDPDLAPLHAHPRFEPFLHLARVEETGRMLQRVIGDRL